MDFHQFEIIVELVDILCYGRSVKSKKPKQKTCPLCRNRYCLAMAPEVETVNIPKSEWPKSVVDKFSASPDRIATARQHAEALLQKVTQ